MFQRYDSTGTGRLLQNDLYKFMKQLHADNPLFPKDIVIDIATALNLRGYFDYDRFFALTRRYPMLFYPVVRIQRAMRHSIIGLPRFRTLDARTLDIYHERRPGDRPRFYFCAKLGSRLRRLAALVPWWRPPPVRVEARQEHRELVRREKAVVNRRRHGGVAGELFEEKRVEREFLEMRRVAMGREEGEEGEEEEEVPSVLRRKYFGVDDEGEEGKVQRVLQRLKGVVRSEVPDAYDSDDDTEEDHFEDLQLDEYEDASHDD